MTDFLPKGYKVPENQGDYLKFKPGDNKFRILTSPILGHQGWEDTPDGNKVHRAKKESDLPSGLRDIKHFWSMPVWSYDNNRIQILTLTQSTIMRSIESFINNPDWGSPLNYNITVNKQGEKLKTEYNIIPSPKSELPQEVTEILAKTPINMEELYRGGHPLGEKESSKSDDLDLDEIDKALS